MGYVKDGINYDEVKYIIVDGMGIVNPTHEQIISAGYTLVPNMATGTVTPAAILEAAKNAAVSELEIYDSSVALNEFFIDDIPMWFNKTDRGVLKMRFDCEDMVGKTTTSIWYDGERYQFAISDAKSIIAQLEVYASECYDQTQIHKQNILSLTTRTAIENYDYTIGYPSKLHFVSSAAE